VPGGSARGRCSAACTTCTSEQPDDGFLPPFSSMASSTSTGGRPPDVVWPSLRTTPPPSFLPPHGFAGVGTGSVSR
jgi:hypothetical protein